MNYIYKCNRCNNICETDEKIRKTKKCTYCKKGRYEEQESYGDKRYFHVTENSVERSDHDEMVPLKPVKPRRRLKR